MSWNRWKCHKTIFLLFFSRHALGNHLSSPVCSFFCFFFYSIQPGCCWSCDINHLIKTNKTLSWNPWGECLEKDSHRRNINHSGSAALTCSCTKHIQARKRKKKNLFETVKMLFHNLSQGLRKSSEHLFSTSSLNFSASRRMRNIFARLFDTFPLFHLVGIQGRSAHLKAQFIPRLSWKNTYLTPCSSYFWRPSFPFPSFVFLSPWKKDKSSCVSLIASDTSSGLLQELDLRSPAGPPTFSEEKMMRR